jgi:sphingolipid 4-desaturase/C4-monooxygenase
MSVEDENPSVQTEVVAARWHFDRSRDIVRAHPEVRSLIAPDARTALLIIALVFAHYAIAWGVRDLPWYLALAIAYGIGIVIAHALGVSIHECAHDLVFSKHWANKAISIFANLPLMFPAAIDFRDKHLRHHRYLGDGDGRDTQAPTPIEARITGRSAWRKILWLSFGPLIFHGAPPKDGTRRATDPWLVVNFIVTVSTMPVIFLYSSSSFIYLFFSALLAFGPHPVGIRRYAEHVALRDGQPTYSYYGVWNLLALNVGHHIEHHDFPGIAWTRLPLLRRIAPEKYAPLAQVRSWTRLLLSLFFDPEFGADRYVRRDEARASERHTATKAEPSR